LPIMASHPTNFNGFLSQLGIVLDDLLPNPQVVTKKTVVGFRFGASSEIHFFQLNYWKEGVGSKFQAGYLLPKNLSNELFARIDTLFDLMILSGKKVLIVGVGSIGSESASELASSGIGHFTLIDEKRFEVGNSVRHAADIFSVGESKVDVVKKIIQAKNPKAKVKIFPVNIFSLSLSDIEGLIDESHVVLDLTANRLVEEYLHQKVCVERGKTLIQAAVSKGGLTGLVLVMTPGKSACLRCLSEMKMNHVPTSNLNVKILKNAPVDYGACSQAALPGSGLDTREVAIQTARVTLQVLLQNENSFYPKLAGYQYYWHGPAGTAGKSPFSWEINDIEALPSCKYCTTENDPKDSFEAERSEESDNRNHKN
jgi:molybdopterin/thiamine biosynthesis adenylyltransferase